MVAHAPELHGHDLHDGHDGGGQRSVWLRGSWVRAFWVSAVMGLGAAGVVMLIRHADGLVAYSDGVVQTFLLLFAGIGFTIGIGCFDYWWGYIIGNPTPAHEDHSSHGARSWKDYFKVNTDHKVIGVQYLVTTFIFFIIGGMLAEGVRAELADAGPPVLLARHLQRALLGARGADDLPVRDPRVRGPRQLRHPDHDRRPGHGVPASERALLLDAARRPGCAWCRRSWSGRSTPAGRTTPRCRCTGRPGRPSG